MHLDLARTHTPAYFSVSTKAGREAASEKEPHPPKNLINTANAIAFVVHACCAFACFTACGSQWQGNEDCVPENMAITIFRIRSNWTSARAQGYDLLPVDNKNSFQFDQATAWFFGISAIFHLGAFIVGNCSGLSWMYWDLMNKAFSPWRWMEYSFSASLMMLCIATLLGIRDQNTLASLYMLMWCTQMFGLLTEWGASVNVELETCPRALLSDKGRHEIGCEVATHRRWANDPMRTEGAWKAILTLEQNNRNIRTKYKFWIRRVLVRVGCFTNNATVIPLQEFDRCTLSVYRWERKKAYVRRMLPHVLGISPYLAAWTIMLRSFTDSLNDVKVENASVWDKIPDFVVPAVFGTFVIFSTFTFVQCAARTHTHTHTHSTAPSVGCVRAGGATCSSAHASGGRRSCGTSDSASAPNCTSAGSSTAACCALRPSTPLSTRQTDGAHRTRRLRACRLDR